MLTFSRLCFITTILMSFSFPLFIIYLTLHSMFLERYSVQYILLHQNLHVNVSGNIELSSLQSSDSMPNHYVIVLDFMNLWLAFSCTLFLRILCFSFFFMYSTCSWVTLLFIKNIGAHKERSLETLWSVIADVFTVITSCFTCLYKSFEAARILELMFANVKKKKYVRHLVVCCRNQYICTGERLVCKCDMYE